MSHDHKPYARGYAIFLGVFVWWALWFALFWTCRGWIFGVGAETA